MKNSETKNDKAWEELFKKYNIVTEVNNKGSFRINANEIKKYREPRLMTKFDHQSNLPKPFKDNKFSILPVTRGDYVIGPMQIYKEIDCSEAVPIKYFDFPEYISSLDVNNINSEVSAISCAYISGILDDFIGEETIATVSGRMSSESFSFQISCDGLKPDMNIYVNNSQIEIDGGFEGANSLTLIEAKKFNI